VIATRGELVSRARALASTPERVILAIVGAPGSGKSTVTEMLLQTLRDDPPAGCTPEWVAHLPMDGFHLADVQLDRLGRRDRKGAADTFDAAGYVATLRRLVERTDDPVYVPGFERDLEQPIAASIAIPGESRLIITEGLYLLHDEGEWRMAAEYFTESWFCVVDQDLRTQRLIERHVRYGKTPDEAAKWVMNVDEHNARVVERSRSRASRLIDIDRLA
jgi:pantothenate kinase